MAKIRLFPEPKNKKEQKMGGCHGLEIKTSRNLCMKNAR